MKMIYKFDDNQKIGMRNYSDWILWNKKAQ